jgi:hypothetical protein
MDKSSKNFLVGQPIFKQILNLIPRAVINKVAHEVCDGMSAVQVLLF